MGLVWNPYAVPGFLALLMAISMAAFVYFAAPGGHAANRRLSLILLLEGCAVGAGNGIIYVVDQAHLAYAAQAVSVTAVLGLPAAYLLLIATLDSPLVRPLKSRVAEALLVAFGAGSVLAFFLNRAEFIAGVAPAWYAPYDADLGAWYINFSYFRLGVLLFAFVVALDAFYRARTAIGRRRAKAFAVAFGLFDAFRIIVTFLFVVLLPRLGGTPGIISTTGTLGDLVGAVVYPSVIILLIPLLALAILRTQLFDIDVKIRFTLNKGALASGALLVFFIVSQVMEQALGNQFGILGGVIAGGLFFLISPIQKAAERLAHRAMPHAKTVDEMTGAHRAELYREQLEFAFADGSVSKKERMLLEHLRQKLGVDKTAAQKLERKVLQHVPGLTARAAPG